MSEDADGGDPAAGGVQADDPGGSDPEGPEDPPGPSFGEPAATGGGSWYPPVPSDERSVERTVGATVLSLLAGIAALGGSYAAVGNSPSFVAAPVSSVVTEYTPDAVVAFSITVLGDAGTKLALLLAVGLAAALFGVVAAAGATFARVVVDHPAATAGTGAVLTGALAAGLTASPASALGAGVAAGVVLAVAAALSSAPAAAVAGGAVSPVRRGLLGGVATAVGIGVAGYLLGGRTSGGGTTEEAAVDVGIPEGSSDPPADLLGMARERSLSVDGMEPLVSEEFYEVDINQFDPELDAGEWSLSVTGAVEEDVEYAFGDVVEMTAQHHFVTLRCVGEDLNGQKMDNALWTGVPVADLLDAAGPQGDYVMVHAADDYYEGFPLDALRTGLLAYGMNGEALPRGHGHPARLLIPGHWGEINVKWVTEIEVLEEEEEGYWEERGWHGTGPVNTVAKLWTVNHLDDGRIELGGHAYAGNRGIARVEVSTDGGRTWEEATLSEGLPGDDVWRQWVYRYERGDPHEVVVRAVDGTGAVQPEERSDAFPSGPTGWVSREVQP